MFVALDSDGRRCELLSHQQADQLRTAGAHVFCPACKERLLIKNGSQLPAHFAHRSHACSFGEPESAEHLRGKLLLRDIALAGGWEAELEVYLPDQQQRIDVLISRGVQRRALEFQCSPLGARRLLERTAGYASVGLATQWLLGKRYFNDKAAAGRNKFAVLGDSGLELRFLDSQNCRLWRDIQVRRRSSMRQALWPMRDRCVRRGRPLHPLAQARQLAQGLHYGQREYVRLQQRCYARGFNLAGCPWVVHLELSDLPGLVRAEDLLRVEWLLRFSGADCITSAANLDFWRQSIKSAALPLVDAQAYAHLLALVFCAALVQRGYLRALGSGWQWLRQPEWYPDSDRKLAHFTAI